jgi:predicted transcriptional regulator YheO
MNIRNIHKIYEINRKYEALMSFIRDVEHEKLEIVVHLTSSKEKSITYAISKSEAVEMLLTEKSRLEKILSELGVEL